MLRVCYFHFLLKKKKRGTKSLHDIGVSPGSCDNIISPVSGMAPVAWVLPALLGGQTVGTMESKIQRARTVVCIVSPQEPRTVSATQ